MHFWSIIRYLLYFLQLPEHGVSRLSRPHLPALGDARETRANVILRRFISSLSLVFLGARLYFCLRFPKSYIYVRTGLNKLWYTLISMRDLTVGRLDIFAVHPTLLQIAYHQQFITQARLCDFLLDTLISVSASLRIFNI